MVEMNEVPTNASDGESNALSPEDAAFSRSVGARLRAVRRAQGMSLADVETRSEGRWSSSAIGAYERGFRNLSVPRLRALAEFYAVPMSVLLGEPSLESATPQRGKLVLDLETLRRVAHNQPVMRFVESIVVARGDYNGRILSLRHDDLRALCALVGDDIPGGIMQLRDWGVLIEGPDLPGLGVRPDDAVDIRG